MTPLVTKARDFAILAHEKQMYGEHPYSYHLQQVHNTLVEFDFRGDPVLAAAWLHDVLEDTPVEKCELEGKFDKRVVELVWAVTDEEGCNRRERKAKTYLKLKDDSLAICLKLADRIANMREAKWNSSPLLRMYQREYIDFKEALCPNGGPEEMWKTLDRLAVEL